MKTAELVVLRKVDEDSLIFDFSFYPSKWATVKDGDEVIYTDFRERSWRLVWDRSTVEAVMPQAYLIWLNLRAYHIKWLDCRIESDQQAFRKWLFSEIQKVPANFPKYVIAKAVDCMATCEGDTTFFGNDDLSHYLQLVVILDWMYPDYPIKNWEVGT